MNTIIYYDANPTVRNLVTQALTARGFSVAGPETLADCRSAIAANPQARAVVLDMSRRPDMLRRLQTDVGEAFPHPERCILTTDRADDLTSYLPESADACFFKHVVGRPFKRNEFADFVAKIAGGAPNAANSAREACAPNAHNAGKAVQTDADKAAQIAAATDASKTALAARPRPDHAPSADVPAICPDASKPEKIAGPKHEKIAGPIAANDAAARKKSPQFSVLPSDPDCRKDSRMSRIGRSRASASHDRIHAREAYRAMQRSASGAPAPASAPPNPIPNSAENPKLKDEEKKGISVQAQILTHIDSSDIDLGKLKIAAQTPKAAKPADAAPSANEETVAESIEGEKIDRAPDPPPSPSIQPPVCDKIPRPISPLPPPFRHAKPPRGADCPNLPETERADTDASGRPSSASPAEIVPLRPKFLSGQAPATPPLPAFRNPHADFAPAPDPTSSSTFSLPPSRSGGAPFESATFRIMWFVRLISESILEQSRFTLVADDGDARHTLFAESGRAFWFETFIGGHVPSVNEYLSSLPAGIVPAEPLKNHVRANRCALSQAFKSLNLEDIAANLCRECVRSGVAGIMDRWSGLRFEVTEGIPEHYAAVIRMRPCKFISLPQIVFEKLRQNADAVFAPKAFSDVRFVMRAFRSPLNVRIQLTPDELDLLAVIQTPKNLAEIKQSGKKHAADALYRLWLFQFVDLCAA